MWFARHGRQSIGEVLALTVSDFRAYLRELSEIVSEEWDVGET